MSKAARWTAPSRLTRFQLRVRIRSLEKHLSDVESTLPGLRRDGRIRRCLDARRRRLEDELHTARRILARMEAHHEGCP